MFKNLTKTENRPLSLRGSATTGVISFNGQVGLSVDTNGDIGFQVSVSDGIATSSPALSLGMYESISNAPSINALEDFGVQAGGSTSFANLPVMIGANVDFMPGETETYYGGTVFAGVGVGTEFHIEMSETKTVGYKINVFNTLDKCYVKVMEWE